MYYKKENDNEQLKEEIDTHKKLTAFALNMYEPLQCHEMVQCSAHMDELKQEFAEMPKIEAQRLVESLREERKKSIEFAKRQAAVIDKTDAERVQANK